METIITDEEPSYDIKTELHVQEVGAFSSSNVCNYSNDVDVKASLYSCMACNMQFMELTALHDHFETHENEKGNRCPVCCKKFLYEHHFKLHMDDHVRNDDQTNHIKQEDESGTAGSVNEDNTQLVMSESGVLCKSELGSSVDYKPNPHLVDILLDTCTNRQTVKERERTDIIHEIKRTLAHSVEKPVKKHVRRDIIHDGKRKLAHSLEKPAVNSNPLLLLRSSNNVGQKSFPGEPKSEIHVPVFHTIAKLYSCEECSDLFTSLSLLVSHKMSMMHAGIKRHTCDVCHKWFTLAGDLKYHKLIHSYTCDVCQKSFTLARYLNRHKRLHSDVKDYTCDVCQKSFTVAHYLKRHKLIHSGVKNMM